jgi:uncharacterized protein YkwD
MHRKLAATTLVASAFVALAIPASSSAVLISRARACPGAYSMPTPTTMVRARIATQCLLNYERSLRRIGPLRGNYQLGAAALAHSRDMVTRNYFAHDTLGGGSFLGRIQASHYIGRTGRWSVGENIAWGGGSLATPAATTASWMRSPLHRANVLRATYHEIGVGMVLTTRSGMPAVVYTTDFGSRG